MQLMLHHSLHSRNQGRLRPYINGTLRALRAELVAIKLVLVNQTTVDCSDLPKRVIDVVLTAPTANPSFMVPIIAYPVPRPRKQRFRSRNYPLNTPSRADLVRVGQALKRRVRVNQGLRIHRAAGKVTAQVVPIQEAHAQPAETFLIQSGMLCSATRAGHTVIGVVSAIHSSGRITLRVPNDVGPNGITWRAVVITRSREMRLLSRQRVLFLKRPSNL